MDRQTLTSPAGGHISAEMTRARFYAQTALSESALCANEHELIPACVYETNNAYIHCSYETWDAETTGHELFTPFSDPQERCTQTGAESRVTPGLGTFILTCNAGKPFICTSMSLCIIDKTFNEATALRTGISELIRKYQDIYWYWQYEAADNQYDISYWDVVACIGSY